MWGAWCWVMRKQFHLSTYTSFHLVESVENCGLCMRQCLAFSSYAQVMHCALAITRALDYDASVKHWIIHNWKPSLPLSCTGYNLYWLDEVNRSIVTVAWGMISMEDVNFVATILSKIVVPQNIVLLSYLIKSQLLSTQDNNTLFFPLKFEEI